MPVWTRKQSHSVVRMRATVHTMKFLPWTRSLGSERCQMTASGYSLLSQFYHLAARVPVIRGLPQLAMVSRAIGIRAATSGCAKSRRTDGQVLNEAMGEGGRLGVRCRDSFRKEDWLLCWGKWRLRETIPNLEYISAADEGGSRSGISFIHLQ